MTRDQIFAWVVIAALSLGLFALSRNPGSLQVCWNSYGCSYATWGKPPLYY